MFTVTSPALLLGLLCLIIPIAIHLFNKSRGRLVKVGSIELLRKLKSSQVKQIKIYRWLLLFLRLCIFTFATLLIAELWLNSAATNEHSRRVLVSSSWLKHAQQDELNDLFIHHKNDQVQLLGQKNEALTAVMLKAQYAELQREQREQGEQRAKPLNIWPLLNQQINALKAEQALTIYLTDEVEHTDFNSVAQIKPNISKPNISKPQAERIDWQIKSVLTEPENEFLTAFTVAIYQQDNRNVSALLAALDSLKQHKIHSLTVSVITKEQLSSVQAEVLFYLADGSLPEHLSERIKQGLVVIKDETLIYQNLRGQSLTEPGISNPLDKVVQQGQFAIVADTPLLADATVFRYVSQPIQSSKSANPSTATKQSSVQSHVQSHAQSNTALPAFWSLSNGMQLLTITRSGVGKLIEFSSRFEPQWFSLPRQAEFPAVLALLLSEHRQLKQYQSINIDRSQLQLGHNGIDQQAASNPVTNTSTRQPLFHYLALLLVVFWLCERVFTESYYRA